jgi:ATP-dependent RNA helicase DeaD
VHHAERGAPADDDETGMEELRLAVGRRDGVRPGEVARLLRDTARLGRQDVGRIHVRDRITLVGIRAELLQSTLEALKDTTYNDRPVAPERGRSTGSNSSAAAPDADD